ncbi:MAG: LPS-assembly protein LptD [Rhodothermales bacterium]|nr:LPS-assembly protein LptD [Rhodothermales bacterium]
MTVAYPCRAQDGGASGDLSSPVRFTASDSVTVRLGAGGDVGSLFGAATVEYEETLVEARRIDILMDREELRATGSPADTVGRPKITQGDEVFTGLEAAFNLRTRRGRLVAARTEYEEGFIAAGVVKSVEDSTLFIRDGMYTTCECVDDPSYSLRSNRMKIVNRKWIYTGPIQLYLYNIPTPLWLPFGFLPAREGRRSGPLPPSYGEDEFGFYLRDWGWYFALNDYMDLQLQGGFWTLGSWEARTLYRYRKRYGFDGQVQFDIGRFKTGESGDPGFTVRRTSAFKWNHNQEIGLSSTFSADVNLSSSSYLRAVSQDYDDRVRQDIRSSLRYSKRWSGQSLTVQASQRQVLSTGNVSMTVPSISFSQRSFKPLQASTRAPGRSERFWEKITLSYNSTLTNRYDFTPLSDADLVEAGDSAATGITWFDAFLSPEEYRRATGDDEQFDFEVSHRIPVSAPFTVRSLPPFGAINLNLSPNFTYTEDWFIRTDERSLSDDSSSVVTGSMPEFFALRQFSAGASASTIFYGTFPLRAFGLDGVRHTVRPNVSFSYRPDFFRDSWGYTDTYLDADGNEVRYALVDGVGRGRQESFTFSLNNTFESRRAAPDSSASEGPAAARGAFKLFDLNASTGLNLAADSLRMSNIRLTARTRVYDRVDVDFNSTFSPYALNSAGLIVNEYDFSLEKPLGRLTSANLTVRTSLRSSRGAGDRPLTAPRAGFPQTGSFGSAGALGAANPAQLQNTFRAPTSDFSIPWSLSLDLTYGVRRFGFESTRSAILNTSFDLSLTPNWKVTGRSGYDFEQNQLATTNLALARDFDCWQMAFNWIPFGRYQSWGFDLHVKSSHLKDLLRIRQPKSDVKDRFGGF